MWFVIIAVLVASSVLFDIAEGRIRGKRGYLYRSASPVLFWFIIALKCVLVLFIAFPKQSLSLVQYGIEDSSAETRRKVQEFQQRQSAEPETNWKAAVETQDR